MPEFSQSSERADERFLRYIAGSVIVTRQPEGHSVDTIHVPVVEIALCGGIASAGSGHELSLGPRGCDVGYGCRHCLLLDGVIRQEVVRIIVSPISLARTGRGADLSGPRVCLREDDDRGARTRPRPFC